MIDLTAFKRYFERGTGNNSKTVATLDLSCEFEPFGIATEDWDWVYTLTLPTIPIHWHHMKDGWKPCEGKTAPMKFKDRTPELAMAKALDFVKWFTNQKEADID